MPRHKNSPEDERRAARLATLLRRARGDVSRNELAAQSGVAPDTIKRIEDARTADPGFFTVVGLADALKLELADVAALRRTRRR